MGLSGAPRENIVKLHLRMTVDVVYDDNLDRGAFMEPANNLAQRLNQIIAEATASGMITDDLSATVHHVSSQVEEIRAV